MLCQDEILMPRMIKQLEKLQQILFTLLKMVGIFLVEAWQNWDLHGWRLILQGTDDTVKNSDCLTSY